jgi:hypothetical protein
MGVYLTDVYLMDVHLIRVHLYGRVSHGRAPHLRAFLARRTRVARIPVSTPIVLRLLIVGDSAVKAAGHPWSALRVLKSCRKDCPTAEVLLEAKAAALHPEWY